MNQNPSLRKRLRKLWDSGPKDRRILAAMFVIGMASPPLLMMLTGIPSLVFSFSFGWPLAFYVGWFWIWRDPTKKDIWNKAIPSACQCGAPLIPTTSDSLRYMQCSFWTNSSHLTGEHYKACVGKA